MGFVTQRAVKLAIKQAIAAEIEASKEKDNAGDTEMDDIEPEDPVPELTKAHFEEAMGAARRSVSDVEVRRYEAFAQSMKQSGGMNTFRFPSEGEAGATTGGSGNAGFGTGGEDDDLYS